MEEIDICFHAGLIHVDASDKISHTPSNSHDVHPRIKYLGLANCTRILLTTASRNPKCLKNTKAKKKDITWKLTKPLNHFNVKAIVNMKSGTNCLRPARRYSEDNGNKK